MPLAGVPQIARDGRSTVVPATVSGQPILFNQILQLQGTGAWKEAIARARQVLAEGYRVYGASNALPIFQRFTMPRIALTPTHQGGIAWSAFSSIISCKIC